MKRAKKLRIMLVSSGSYIILVFIKASFIKASEERVRLTCWMLKSSELDLNTSASLVFCTCSMLDCLDFKSPISAPSEAAHF